MQVLVLAPAQGGAAGIDLATGGLVRARFEQPAARPLRRFHVVEAAALPDEAPPFAPDSVLLGQPTVVGRLTGRRADKLLRPLVHPPAQPLFGFPASSAPFWELNGDRPSLALVAGAERLAIHRTGLDSVRCRFRWRRLDHDLPLQDADVVSVLTHPTVSKLNGRTLHRALGWRPHRLLVALTPPHDGRCHKVVAGVLPKP